MLEWIVIVFCFKFTPMQTAQSDSLFRRFLHFHFKCFRLIFVLLRICCCPFHSRLGFCSAVHLSSTCCRHHAVITTVIISIFQLLAFTTTIGVCGPNSILSTEIFYPKFSIHFFPFSSSALWLEVHRINKTSNGIFQMAWIWTAGTIAIIQNISRLVIHVKYVHHLCQQSTISYWQRWSWRWRWKRSTIEYSPNESYGTHWLNYL